MSRSGYSDDYDNWSLIRWRGAVASSIRGKRGQKLLIELAEAMDAMPEKKLITHELKNGDNYCALGVVGVKRNIAVDKLDPENSEEVAKTLDIAEPLAKEIVYLNDEVCGNMTPEKRWSWMREWVQNEIKNHN